RIEFMLLIFSFDSKIKDNLTSLIVQLPDHRFHLLQTFAPHKLLINGPPDDPVRKRKPHLHRKNRCPGKHPDEHRPVDQTKQTCSMAKLPAGLAGKSDFSI